MIPPYLRTGHEDAAASNAIGKQSNVLRFGGNVDLSGPRVPQAEVFGS